MSKQGEQILTQRSFTEDLAFLQRHKKTVVLRSADGSGNLVLIPDYQGRVFTSSARGTDSSYGWINYELIKSGALNAHINSYGGEDRFWLGPEAGQFSIFFKKNSPFTLEHWQTPPPIDSESFTLSSQSTNRAGLAKHIRLVNYADQVFEIDLKRTISIFDRAEIEKNFNEILDAGISCVGFQSHNTITNVGAQAWRKETGLLSIWILGMFKPSEQTTVIIPYRGQLELNTAYFGAVGADRLRVAERAILFRGDGRYRSKIGIPPANTLPVLGSFDAANGILTIVEFTFSDASTYVNSLWEMQDDPYAGDVVNSYNDGPQEDGTQLGPFYELETSSDARELGVGESMTHLHKTFHFEGEFGQLNALAKKLLHTDLNALEI